MSRLWADDEPIQVMLSPDLGLGDSVDDEGHVVCPIAFTWRGRTHPIERLHEEWRTDTDWWEEDGGTTRHYFKITTRTGLLCEIYLDDILQLWFMSRVYD